MTEKRNITKDTTELRKLAEQEAARFQKNTNSLSPEETQRVLHELRVHQIELEMQNEELRTSQIDLEDAKSRYFDLYNLAPVGYVTVNEQGLILEANLTVSTLLGVPRDSVVKRPFSQFILKQDQDIFYLNRNQLLETNEPQSCELRMLKKDEKVFWAHLAATVPQVTDGGQVWRVVISDITERKYQEDERALAGRLIVLVNTPGDFRAIMSELTASLQGWSGCEAVGIRLRDRDDYPYYEMRGFPPEFVRKENHLCSYGPDGKVLRDGNGNPLLECMCGNILCGRFDPSKPFFTEHGSFWSNCTTALLASTTEADRQARTRNRCNGEGYESVALIPLRAANQVFGLLQFNDHRPNRFTPEMIANFERKADSLAGALYQRQAEEALRESDQRYRTVSDYTYDWEYWIAPDGSLPYISPSCERITGYGIEEFLKDPGLMVRIINPQDREFVAAHLSSVGNATGAECHSLDYRILTRSGEERWLNHVCQEIYSRDGKYLGRRASTRDITERKLADEELKFKNTLLSNQQESSIDGILVVNEDDRIESYNRRFVEIFHIPPELVESRDDRPVLQYVTSLMAAPSIFLHRVQYLYEHRSETGQDEISLKDGRTLDRYSAPMHGADGKYYGRVWYFRDITQQKRAETALKEKEKEYQELIENLSSGLVVHDPDTSVLLSNPMAVNLLGLTKDQMQGKTALDPAWCFIGEDGTPLPLAEYPVNYVLLSGKPLKGQMLGICRPDRATPIWVLCDGYPVCDADGHILKVVVTFVNVTERKEAEDSLRTSESEFRSLAESMPQIVWVTRPDGWNTYFNQQWVEYTGLTLEESYGHGWSTPFHPDDRKRAEDAWQEATQNDTTYSLECRLRRADDTYRWWLIRGVPVRDGSGKILKWFGTCTDIEDIKQEEEKRIKLESQLLQSQKMEAVGQLAGGIAHDFNNMLTVINAYSQMVLNTLAPFDPNHASIKAVLDAGKRSADLTRQLLAFARKQIISPKMLDLNDNIDGMLNMLRRIIGENIELSWKPSAHLWKIKMDPSQIDQILANLLVNARDAMSGGGKVVIETANADIDKAFCEMHPDSAPGKYVVLSVNDSGCGMNKETQEHMFEPFFTTKKFGAGTGLGLATVFGIVKQNKGTISAYSEPGKGTTFKIYLPRYESEDADSDEECETVETFRGTGTVLLVEDEQSLLLIAKILIENLGYTVLSTSNPSEAIKIAEEYKGEIHLLMTDVIMPGLSGSDLQKQISTLRPGIKCLFMSGYSSDVISHNGVLAKGVHFLQKPFTNKDLSVKLHEALD